MAERQIIPFFFFYFSKFVFQLNNIFLKHQCAGLPSITARVHMNYLWMRWWAGLNKIHNSTFSSFTNWALQILRGYIFTVLVKYNFLVLYALSLVFKVHTFEGSENPRVFQALCRSTLPNFQDLTGPQQVSKVNSLRR